MGGRITIYNAIRCEGSWVTGPRVNGFRRLSPQTPARQDASQWLPSFPPFKTLRTPLQPPSLNAFAPLPAVSLQRKRKGSHSRHGYAQHARADRARAQEEGGEWTIELGAGRRHGVDKPPSDGLIERRPGAGHPRGGPKRDLVPRRPWGGSGMPAPEDRSRVFSRRLDRSRSCCYTTLSRARAASLLGPSS